MARAAKKSDESPFRAFGCVKRRRNQIQIKLLVTPNLGIKTREVQITDNLFPTGATAANHSSVGRAPMSPTGPTRRTGGFWRA
jgi:hypothetical protein